MNRIVFCLALLWAGFSHAAESLSVPLPSGLPGTWTAVGRTTVQTNVDSAVIQGGYVVTEQSWDDAEITFRARVPLAAGQVQIWAGLRQRDRDSR